MKKTSLLIACLMLSVSLAACGTSNKPDMGSQESSSQESISQESVSSESSEESSEVSESSSQSQPDESKEKPGDKKPDEKKPEDKKPQAKKPENSKDIGKLTDALGKISKGANIPSADIFALNKSNFKDYSFISWVKGIEAACSETSISSSPHSMVLVKCKDGNGKEIAKKIAAKADLNKWLCVQAETGKVIYNDHYVLMVMTFKDAYGKIKDNFTKLVGDNNLQTLDIKSASK